MFVKLCHLDLRTLGVLGDVEGEQLDVLGDGGAGGGPRRQVVSRARHAPGGQTSNLSLRVLHGVNILRQRLGRRLLGVRSLNKPEKLVSACLVKLFISHLAASNHGCQHVVFILSARSKR